MPYAYDPKDLRLFKAVVQTRNLPLPARALNMTASLASYRLKSLEYTAGSSLFVRGPQGMASPAGEAMASTWKVLFADLQAMHAEVGGDPRELHLVRKQVPEQEELVRQFATILMHDPLVVATRSAAHWA